MSSTENRNDIYNESGLALGLWLDYLLKIEIITNHFHLIYQYST